MARFTFAFDAEQDLTAIVDTTLANWGTEQAIKYVDGLQAIAQTLADNPDIGLNRDALSAGLLSFPYKSHILYYLKTADGISIIRVLHTRMDSTRIKSPNK